MPNIPQILGLLGTELSKQLVVSYTVKESLPNDEFVFVSFLRNNSSMAIKNIRGSIAPTQCTDFPVTQFVVRDLQPGQENELAVVHARMRRGSQYGSVLDDIGRVTLTAAADLSSLQFQERDKPLIHSRSAVQRVTASRHSPVVRRRERGIPLSPSAAFDFPNSG